jgi:hypothetical protein
MKANEHLNAYLTRASEESMYEAAEKAQERLDNGNNSISYCKLAKFRLGIVNLGWYPYRCQGQHLGKGHALQCVVAYLERL